MSGLINASDVETGDAGEAVAHVVVSGDVSCLDNVEGGELDFLTGFAHQVRNMIGDGTAVHVESEYLFASFGVSLHGEVDELLAGGNEFCVLSDEVGFAAEHEDVTLGAVGVDLSHYAALVGSTVGTLSGDFLAFLSEDVDSFVEIAFCFYEGVLAIHHTDTGHFSQLIDLCCFDFHIIDF